MPYQTRTLADLRTRLQDRWDNTPFWTNEEARLALNEGLLLWNLMTGTWRDRATITTHPDDQFIALPAPILWPGHLEWNSVPLDRSSIAALDAGQPGWQGQRTIDGGKVPAVVTAWAPVSLKLIAIFPRDGVGGGTLTIDGLAKTPELVNDVDYVDLSAALDNVLLGYALHIMAFKSPYFEATQSLIKAFILAAGEENALFKASSIYRKAIYGDAQKSEKPIRLKAADAPAG